MNKKFMIYAVVVTVLTTAVSWKNLFTAQYGDQSRGAGRGSVWSSFMGGGSWSGGSGGHK